MIAVDPKQKIIFKVDDPNSNGNATLFYCRPVTAGKMRKLMVKFKGTNEANFDIEEIFQSLNEHITGWDNLKNSSGNLIVYQMDKSGKCADENWENFTIQDVVRIWEGFLKANQIGEVAEKNL